ncbi:MAG: SurA N-terminal domain-containing protein, partial [Paracoccaceae bacterium]
MLHLLRRAAKTWAFRLLFALLIVSFAVWGIGDLSMGGGSARVAQVGDRRITVEEFGTALGREIDSLSRRAERPITLEDAREAGLPQRLLSRIVRDAALDEEARRLGLSADDEELREAILASPSFQGLDGSFDPEAYRFILDRLGFTVERFETDLRRSLARDAVAYGVRAGAPAAPGFAEALVADEFERRAFAVLVLPLSAAPEPEAPSESELRAFHEANAEAYRAPERRETVWLEVDPEALADTVAIPEAELRAAYEAAGDRYATPERRAVDRLGFETAEAAREAVAAIEAGETTFEALVSER